MKTIRYEVTVEGDGVTAGDEGRILYVLQDACRFDTIRKKFKVVQLQESLTDTQRLDWLDKHYVEIANKPLSAPGFLRDIIDSHIRPKPEPRYVSTMTVGELADIPAIETGLHGWTRQSALNVITGFCRQLVREGMRRGLPYCDLKCAPALDGNPDINEILHQSGPVPPEKC